METVLLKQLRTYDPDALEPVIDRIFRTFGVYDDLRPGMTAVLKPCSSRRWAAACRRPGPGCSSPRAPAGPTLPA